jgi:hypothetical protein
LVRNASSIGGSNDTVEAAWITALRSSGRVTSVLPSSPSITRTRSATAAATASAPTASRQVLNTGRFSSVLSRSAPDELPRRRISSVTRVVG